MQHFHFLHYDLTAQGGRNRFKRNTQTPDNSNSCFLEKSLPIVHRTAPFGTGLLLALSLKEPRGQGEGKSYTTVVVGSQLRFSFVVANYKTKFKLTKYQFTLHN